MEIIYTSPNGYTGRLYGKSSMSIYDSVGTEVFHTGTRSINTYNDLVETIDAFPGFLKMLMGFSNTINAL